MTYEKFAGYETEPMPGDEISTSYWDKDVTRNEECDSIKVISVGIYAEDVR